MTTEELLHPASKVMTFALPGAFTPVRSTKHAPGFLASIEAIKGKDVETVACISVDDAFEASAAENRLKRP